MSGRSQKAPSKVGISVPTFRSEVGTRLRELESRFANRASAAAVAGVAKSTLQNWIEGRADPSFEGVSRLCSATGASLDWLATGEGPGAPVPVDEELLTEVIDEVETWLGERQRALPPEKKAALISIIYGEMIKTKASGEGAILATVERLGRLVS